MNRLSDDHLSQEVQGFIDDYVRDIRNCNAGLSDEKIRELVRRVVGKFNPRPTDDQVDNYFISRGLFW
ncbi:hypothetical protein GCM10011247_39610 [Pseudomonas plecoglossicida]|nr:hypothetical protein GCM10011247_39610 [Pseudomonas plecoglossicida]